MGGASNDASRNGEGVRRGAGTWRGRAVKQQADQRGGWAQAGG